MSSDVQEMTVDGRPAMILYINDDLEPVEKADATMMRVIWTDEKNGSAFIKVKKT